jgi:hypothetical protein
MKVSSATIRVLAKGFTRRLRQPRPKYRRHASTL